MIAIIATRSRTSVTPFRSQYENHSGATTAGAPTPQCANVTATNGAISTADDRRDQRHASPTVRRVAPSNATDNGT